MNKTLGSTIIHGAGGPMMNSRLYIGMAAAQFLVHYYI